MKTLFWNVDTQYDFMRDDEEFKGALPVAGARAIEGNLETLTKLAREKGIVIVNTADWHNEKTEELSDKPNFVQTFPKHCMQNTKGAEYIPATQPINPYVIDWNAMMMSGKALLEAKEIVMRKDKFDIFKGNQYANKVVELLNPTQAVVYGVATNVCVDRAVQGLLDRKVDVYVPMDAIKELPGLPLEQVLNSWKSNGAKLTTTSEIARYL